MDTFMQNLINTAVYGLIGVVMATLCSFIEKRVLRWYHGLKEVEHSE